MSIALSSSQLANAAIVARVAQSYGVNPNLAVATAYQESGLSNTAVGDNGTSFGLFQLHRGGELGNMSQAQAENPTTNASTALRVFADTQARNPNLSGGALAAASQRPANQAAYAASVDSLLRNTFGPGAAGTSVSRGSGPPITSAGSTGSVPTPANTSVVGGAFERVGETLLGLILVIVGLVLAVPGFRGGEVGNITRKVIH